MCGALAIGIVANALAQISAGMNGTPTITFDASRILPASEWATTTNGIIPGDSAILFSLASVDAAAQTVDQSSIDMPLARITSNTFFRAARHNTNGGYLITQPTTVTAVPIKGHASQHPWVYDQYDHGEL